MMKTVSRRIITGFFAEAEVMKLIEKMEVAPK